MTLVTTLRSPEVSAVADLAERSCRRWPVETALAPRQTTLQRAVLHCNTGPGVRKAWTGFAIVDTLVRMVMRPSATRQHPAVERISCLDALRWRSAP
jgi:hypothetical protein